MFIRLYVTAILSAIPFLAANADVQHLDDVIIDGSTCTGFDCVNGEVFSFDTQRLKENNLRIYFEDTSNTSAFPTNDWRIVINDTTNGGDAYFAIEDSEAGVIPFRVEAGAGASAMYVETGGNVGLGTSSPATNLHVVSGNTPTLRLDQDTSQGFGAGTWNLSGNDSFFSVRDSDTGTPEMRLDPNGDLTITGQLTTAANTYPDYVFKPGYKLMPMDELKEFIDAQGHLPNVPPADEIVKNGLNLTEMNVKLMEKVEELTLYTLQQQETITALMQRLEKLEREQQKIN